MLNYLLATLTAILLSGCGTSTNSSADIVIDSTDGSSSIYVDDGNMSDDSNTSGDSNTSDDPGSGGGTITPPDDPNYEPVFDPADSAVFDTQSCDSSLFSATPLQDSALSAREEVDELNGMTVKSLYPETFNELESLVTIYYNKFPADQVLQDERTVFYGDNSQYYIAYDLEWLNVANNSIYIQIPQLDAERPSCYKITLDKEQGTSVSALKVYR